MLVTKMIRRYPPPWHRFPNSPHDSIGWHMGPEADYLEFWGAWYKAHPEELRMDLAARCPEPKGWKGFYIGLEIRRAKPRYSSVSRVADQPAPAQMD